MVHAYSKIFGNLKPVFDGRSNLYVRDPLPIGNDQVELEVTLDGEGKDRVFRVTMKWAAQVSLFALEEALEGRTRQIPFDAIQALDVVMRHLPSMTNTPVGRSFSSAEQELADTNETLADLGNVNQSIAAAKRKLESEFNQLGADLDEMSNEARLSEDKAARLADELRCEQDLAMNLEKDKKLLEAQCKDAGARADEAEVNALKGGRKAMIKMETRIRELESELDAESRRN